MIFSETACFFRAEIYFTLNCCSPDFQVEHCVVFEDLVKGFCLNIMSYLPDIYLRDPSPYKKHIIKNVV